MNYSKFGSVKVKMTGIEWSREGLPEKEEYSIGFDTLLQNGVVEESEDGMDWRMDEEGLRELAKDMLEEDYRERPKDFLFMFSIVP